MGEKRRSVLIIDNDRDVAEIVHAILTDEGYQVAILSELGADAIASSVGRLEPDAILLDGESELAGYGGSWDRAASLSQRRRPIPVIMFSAHHGDVDEAREAATGRSQRAHFAAVVSKPFEIEDLLRAVALAVGQTTSFDRSVAADLTRSRELATDLERIGAKDVHRSDRREWVTFRSPRGRTMQIYWWQTGGSYLVGRYDEDGRRLENLALVYDRSSAVQICEAVLRAEEVAG